MQGAAAQAAAYQGIGQNIGGAIEKYGLNKEREKKANARIKASIQGLDSYVEAGVITDAQRLQAKEMLQNPDASSSEKVAFIEQQEKQLFQLPKVLLAKAQASNAALENRVLSATEQARINDLKNKSILTGINTDVAKLNLEGLPGNIRATLENVLARTAGVKAGTAKTITETKGIPGKLDRGAREQEGRILAQQLSAAETTADLTREAAAEEAYSAAEQARDAKKKAVATAEETEARTGKLIAELGALLEANKPIDDSMLVGVEDALLPIDIATAAGGDVAGWWQDAANWVAGIAPIAGGTGWNPDRIRERTNLANLQGMVVPAFLRGISTHGGKWAREDIMRMIPQEDDNNANMRSKIKRLIPHMRKKLVEAHHIYSKGTSNASVRNTALQIKTQFPGVIKVLVRSVGGGDKIAEAEQFLREGQ
jgi:hypothetical protein